jgi:hypothetical protein
MFSNRIVLVLLEIFEPLQLADCDIPLLQPPTAVSRSGILMPEFSVVGSAIASAGGNGWIGGKRLVGLGTSR